MGHGFIRDDFAWVTGSRTTPTVRGVLDLLHRDNGFYRPIVAATFAIDEWLFGLHPFGYAATNFLLVVAAGAAVVALARGLGLSWAQSLMAGALWALNWHGIGDALMWISGRTASLLVFFVVAAAAWVRGCRFLATVAAFLALLSKEEAVLLPLILASWASLGGAEGAGWRWRRGLMTLLIFGPPLAVYFWLRSQTAAYLPGTAPPFYAPTTDAALLARNFVEYLDRAATFPALVVGLMALSVRKLPRLTTAERSWALRGFVWMAGGYGLTLFLPVRSSLYACFPSVGTALAAAAVAGALWRTAGQAARRRWLVAAIAGAVLLVPLLRSRHARLERTASLSARTLAAVAPLAPELGAGRWLVLRDTDRRVNLRAAFGTLLEVAIRLHTGVPGARAWIEPPPPDWQAAGLEPAGSRPQVVLELREGQLRRVQ